MDKSMLDSLKEGIRKRLETNISTTNEELLKFIEEAVFSFSQNHYLNAKEKHSLITKIFYSFRGLDILQPMMDDSTITEIMINSHEEIFFEQEGRTIPYSDSFESPQKLEDIIQSIVGKVNRIVNESSPIVDARLPDGSRVNVVLPPIALKGPTMTIRKFPEEPLTMQDLIRKGAITEEAAEFLKRLVKAKYNIFIGGGTGSGKTTFLNALSNFIPADERIITIEDSAELKIQSIPNLVSLETRNVNTEGKGEITMRDLIRSSLRMRPNRIVVGEVRGPEALDMLQAMNTGHDGSLSTGHANSSRDMLSRLETMVLSGAGLPVEVIRKQISSAIDILIHISRLRDRTRRIVEISEIVGMEQGEVQLNPLYEFKEEGEEESEIVKGKLQSTKNKLRNDLKFQMAGMRSEVNLY
jgi:pilus assembly protein CpaF